MPSDPFVDAYLHGSDQGLSLAEQVAAERFAREQEQRRRDEFATEQAFRERQAALSNTRGDVYLDIARRQAVRADQNAAIQDQLRARALAESDAARRFDMTRYTGLSLEDGPPAPADMPGGANDFGAMDDRSRAAVLRMMQDRADMAMDRRKRDSELRSVDRDLAAMDALAEKAGGWHKEGDPLIEQLRPKYAALNAAKMKLSYDVPMQSTMAFQTAQLRNSAQRPGADFRDTATIRERLAAERARLWELETALARATYLKKDADEDLVQVGVATDGTAVEWPLALVRAKIAASRRMIVELSSRELLDANTPGPPAYAPPRPEGFDEDAEELELVRRKLRETNREVPLAQ